MPPKNHREFLHGHHFRALLRLDIHLAERSRTESSAERPPEPLRRRRRRKNGSEERGRRRTHGVLDGIGGDDGGVVAGGVGGEAVGDDADGDAPLDDDVAPRRGGAAPDAGDADAGLAVPALELEVPGHGRRGDLICGCRGGACECDAIAIAGRLVVCCTCALCRRGGSRAVRGGVRGCLFVGVCGTRPRRRDGK